jgi:hypothetical protein
MITLILTAFLACNSNTKENTKTTENKTKTTETTVEEAVNTPASE